MKRLYGVETLDGFGALSPAEVSALGLVAAHLEATQAGKVPLLRAPRRGSDAEIMAIDPATRASLELDRTQSGTRDGSLLAAVDRTVTSAGARLLADRLARPLLNPALIHERLDAVAYFRERRRLREDVRAALRGAGDPARSLTRLALGRGGPRDLAALRARAEPTDGGWLVSGQKVWTSYARHATWGIALVRTDSDAPRHSGISCMAIAMDAPGVDIRPLRQITGESEFNEVFLDEVFVPEDQLIGGLHQGWAVASTTLAHERGVGFPFKEQVVHEVYLEDLVALASRSGRLGEPAVDDALVDALVLVRILRLYNWRTLSRLARGIEPGPESSLVKLAWTEMTQRLSSAALVVLGDQAPLWPTPEGDLAAGTWQRQWLWSKAAGIAGGTTEVQRTIVAERLLGLPRAAAD